MTSPQRPAPAKSRLPLCLGTILAILPAVSSAVTAELRQKDGTTPTIVVQTKPGERSYSVLRTPSIPVLLETRGRCDEGDRVHHAQLRMGLRHLDIEVDQGKRSYSEDEGRRWRTHQLDLPTNALSIAVGGKPLAENVDRERLSAVAMCNRELARLAPAERERMLSSGQRLLGRSGLAAAFTLGCAQREGPRQMFHEYVYKGRAKTADAGVDVFVQCAAMTAANAPQPRSESETRGPPPRPGRPLPPAIESVALRVGISQQQSCPDSVRLVGTITARAASRGSYIFMGDGYLSARGEYRFDAAGNRNVVAERRIDWSKVPMGLAAGPGARRSVQGWVQFNVQPEGADRPITSERMPFTVTCNAPPAPSNDKTTR